jgi:hypothetical protein
LFRPAAVEGFGEGRLESGGGEVFKLNGLPIVLLRSVLRELIIFPFKMLAHGRGG